VLTSTHGLLELSWVFFGWCAATAATQLLANLALIEAFRSSSFSQSIALHKLEVVIGALLGITLFAESPSALGWLGVLVSTVGVFLINPGGAGERWRNRLPLDRGALLALLCALLLAFAGFVLKEAVAELVRLNPRVGAARFEAAAHTVFHTTWIEVVALSTVIGLRNPGEFREVLRERKLMVGVGFASFCGSLCWFWAYSLAFVAYVRAVGQIEAVLSVLISLYVFREAETLRQIPGVAVVTVGIGLVLLG
jgi:drug/metabolite transporter (DMT)-like permease